MSTNLTKENTIPVLVASVRLAQKMGAFLLRETALLNDAIQYFNPDVKEKPELPGDNPEVVAVNLLLQGIQKAQAHGGEHAFSIEDAALLWKIMEFWIKESGKAVTENVNIGGSSKSAKKTGKSAAASVRSIQTAEDEEESDEEESRDEIRPLITSKGKGKDKA